jgi:hypothetical protein
MTRFLYAVEEQSKFTPDAEWTLLPNTVQVRRHHCEWEIKNNLAEQWPNERYRIVKYERVESL